MAKKTMKLTVEVLAIKKLDEYKEYLQSISESFVCDPFLDSVFFISVTDKEFKKLKANKELSIAKGAVAFEMKSATL